jgi:hypothetical protein
MLQQKHRPQRGLYYSSMPSMNKLQTHAAPVITEKSLPAPTVIRRAAGLKADS